MDMKISKTSPIPVYQQIADEIRRRILCGTLPGGSVLPSERSFARLLDVHRNTVAKAYAELKSDGWIESRRGSGYTVARYQPSGSEAADTKGNKRVNWMQEIKDSHLDMEMTFDDLFWRFADTTRISMGSGIAAPEVICAAQVARDVSWLFLAGQQGHSFYNPVRGDRSLRQMLANFLSTKGIRASAGEIQVLLETNQALDFILRLLIRPGDAVYLEEIVHPDISRAVTMAGGVIVTVPMDDEGLRCDVLERMLQRELPRLIIVNSSFHDPTGICLSLERRRKLIELSNTYRIPIVEEDAASELCYEGERLPTLKALDTLGNVIYIHSFSLTFVPGLSLAFVAADSVFIRSISRLASVCMMNSDWMTQMLLEMYLQNGEFYRCLEAFRLAYAEKQELVCRKLDEMASLGVSYRRPRGGAYIWCRLPPGIDGKGFINKAANAGVALIPGHVFYPMKNGGRDHVRINYTYESTERLREGMDILRRTLEELCSKP